MSKKLIAGAGVVASLAVALAPLATFATHGHEADQHTDRHVVTVTPSCTFGTATTNPATNGIGHNEAGTNKATWNRENSPAVESDGTGADLAATTYSDQYTNKSIHVAEYTTIAGKLSDDFASTQLKVICNNDSGYVLTANPADLKIASWDSTNNNFTIPVAASPSAAASGYNLAITSTTKATSAAVDAATVTTAGEVNIAHNTSVSLETGDVYDIVYDLGVKASQKAGTYTGDVIYTIWQGQDTNN